MNHNFPAPPPPAGPLPPRSIHAPDPNNLRTQWSAPAHGNPLFYPPGTPQYPLHHHPPHPSAYPPDIQHHQSLPHMNSSNPAVLHPSPSSNIYNITQPSTSFANSLTDNSAALIELELSAVDLKNKDVFSTSDPICYLQVPQARTIRVTKETKWKSINKTEIQLNTLRPSWSKRFPLPYLFEENQFLRFYVIDVDNKAKETGDKLGMCDTTLADVVMAGTITLPLVSCHGLPGNHGRLTIRAHDLNTSGQVRLDLSMAAKGLQNMEFMGTSDPFYRISCEMEGQDSSSLICTSEQVQNNLDPQWRPQRILVPAGGRKWDSVFLRVTVLDHNDILAHKVMGEAKVSLSQFLYASTIPLEHPTKTSRKSYGELVIDAKATEIPTFTSFVQGGLKLRFVVAVDFTSSNKPATDPASLHYLGDPNNPSVYARALSAVGGIISHYIDDDCITGLGFGAKLPGHNRPSFDFSMNGQADPRVRGVDGLLDAYHGATQQVKFSGPTLFTPVIKDVMAHCAGDPVTQHNQYFTVLLVITDGIITDLRETVETIIDASYEAPMSIVIVGVGDADFKAMEFLDGDRTKLSSMGFRLKRTAKRDIVQFTKFDESTTVDELAAEVLHEIPEQLVEYMMDKQIKPGSH